MEILSHLWQLVQDPNWFVPLALSVGGATMLPLHFKGYLKSSKHLPLIVIAIGFVFFVVARWAMLANAGVEFTVAQFALSVLAAMVVIGATPWLYDNVLPQSFRDKYSYSVQRAKVISDV